MHFHVYVQKWGVTVKGLSHNVWKIYKNVSWRAQIDTSVSQSETPWLSWVITNPVIGGERRGRAEFAQKRPFFGKYTAFQGWNMIFLRKWTLSITVTRIAHVNKGGSFIFSPIFSLFWIKKWDAFWRVDPSLAMYASVSWNSPSWPEL